MLACLRRLLSWLMGVFRSREDLLLENLALRQQKLALRAQRPRPRPFRRVPHLRGVAPTKKNFGCSRRKTAQQREQRVRCKCGISRLT